PHKSAYVATIAATGGQPPYDFELVSGSLPAGLTLNSDGTITGSATASTGIKSFKVKVTDAANPKQSSTRQLSIRVVRGPTELRVDPILIEAAARPGLFN